MAQKIYYLTVKGLKVFHSPNLTLVNNYNASKYKNKGVINSR